MEQKEVLEWAGRHIIEILVALSFIIQITPIKLNPWSALIKWVGKLLTSNIHTELSQVKKQVEQLNKNVDENEKDRIRWEVLDFATSCREGKFHSLDEFKHIISLNDKYKLLLQRTKDKNGVFDAEYNYIDEIFKQRQRKNDFVQKQTRY